MGACASRPESCVGGRLGGLKKKSRRRRKGVNRKVSFQVSDRPGEKFDKPVHSDRSFISPTFRGSAEEAWYDSAVNLDSDCSDDDFQSVADDLHSVIGLDVISLSSITSPRYSNHKDGDLSLNSSSSTELLQRPEDTSNSESASRATKSAGYPNGHSSEVHPVFLDEISSVADDSPHRENGLLDNCGILPNNCLPCLASTSPSVEKRKSLSSESPSAKKKATLKLPFKWKEGSSIAHILSSKALLHRPLAGSQIPFCRLEKRVSDSWSFIEPSSFKVRGANYLKDKKKDFAPNCAAYYPFGVDLFLSPRKLNHVARFVELPAMNHSGKLPPILVVNAQIPLYPTALFQNETDGEGFNIVMYYKLNESYAKELPAHFQESILKMVNDEVEKVRSFPTDTIVPFRERLKILGRIGNVDDIPMNAGERKIMHTYNEKPVLSRPQHEFYMGENYLEIDLDMHRFSYISRKGFEAFLDRLKYCVMDFGLTIQGNKTEELPEQILCCVRLNELDYVNYQQLGFSNDTLL